MQAAPKPPTMQAAPKPPTMQPVMMMMPMQMQPQQVAQPINITIVNYNGNKNEKPIKGHHGEEHWVSKMKIASNGVTDLNVWNKT